mmetsp:Transcript_32711/g.62817  ORF Transcript_32711/g.62817 Transcript_32711/m.62817 type:complete len:139 (+) Transcript_32711:1593-2009(+)
MEKDGPSAWCEPTGPSPWQGQRVPGATNPNPESRLQCSDSTWDPAELQSQCFGLGGERAAARRSAAACRDACCADAACATWQWREDKGCFYGGNVNLCDPADPEGFKPFQGRRKHVATRKYSPAAYGHTRPSNEAEAK